HRFDDVAIPALVAHGRFGGRSAAAAAGYGAWLRLTRVPGTPFDSGRLDALPAARQQDFAADFGRTVARLQHGGAMAGRSLQPLDDEWRPAPPRPRCPAPPPIALLRSHSGRR